jgi:WD40 repeat protein
VSQWKKRAVVQVREARCVVRPVFFSSDGKTLACMEGGRILLSNTGTGTELLRIKAAGPGTIALAPDGKSLASAGKGSIRLWDTATGLELFQLPSPAEGTAGLAFSRDGKRLASLDNDRMVRIWDVAERNERTRIKLSGRGESFAFSPDGNRLAVGMGGSVVICPVPAR